MDKFLERLKTAGALVALGVADLAMDLCVKLDPDLDHGYDDDDDEEELDPRDWDDDED